MTENESLALDGITVREIDFSQVSHDDVTAWFHYDTIMEAESPLTAFQLPRAALGMLQDDVAVRLFVARDPNGAVAADGRMVTPLTADNSEVRPIHIGVRSDRRGRGIGRALLKLLVEAAETQGCTTLVGWTTDQIPAGPDFARRFGGERLLDLVTNKLLISKLDRNKIEQWMAEGSQRNSDYDLMAINGAYPSEMVEALVELRVIANSGHPRFLHEKPVFSVEAVRGEEARLVNGKERATIVTIHRPTGMVAGFSYAYYQRENARHVWQAGTAVHPEHRGRCLGKWLKAAMFEQILTAWPGAEEVITSNVATNEPIIGMNQALGFKPVMRATAWQAPVARVREALLL